MIQSEQFTPEPDLNQVIEQEDSICFAETKWEVVLKVDSSVAHYFQRRTFCLISRLTKLWNMEV